MPNLRMAVRFVQVKTSEGIPRKGHGRSYSFHAKLRSNADPRAFYAWIALTPQKSEEKLTPQFYIFHHTEVARFDDLSLDSYQKTDNQKTTLHINSKGKVLNQGRIHDFSCFKEFHDNFEKLEELFDEDEYE